MSDEREDVNIPENIDEIFDAAVFIVQNLPKKGPFSVANDEKLKFYSLFKQATDGPCDRARPPFWQPIERFKHDGWNSLRDMDPKLAKHIYVRKMQKMIDKVYKTHDVSDLFSYAGEDIEEMDAKMRPKFKLIGRELLSPQQTEAVFSGNNTDNGFTEVTKTIPLAHSEDTLNCTGASDDEYADAWETPIIEDTVSQLPKIQKRPKPTAANASAVCEANSRVEVLAEQVKRLSQNLLEQNKIMKELLTQIPQLKRRRGLGGLSWWMFAIIILWPFFVKHVFKAMIKIMFYLVQ